MTSFAQASFEFDAGSLGIELRAVNHRYLDVQLRLPDELRSLEPALRESIAAQISRGKVECRANFIPRSSARQPERLNPAMLRALASWSDEVRAVMPDVRGLSVAEVLGWNGVLEGAAVSNGALHEALLGMLPGLLRDFSATREREGAKMQAFLMQRLIQLEKLCVDVAPRVPMAIAAYEQKLAARLREAMADDDRLRQEIALFSTRIDVDEELSRLLTHLAETRRVLVAGGVSGKRLDFLMQELHREANTLGSKSADAELSRASMEMKILIEQMREQVQNIE